MPELPEVETVARRLHPAVRGRRVCRLVLLDPRLRLPGRSRLEGARLLAVRRVGKEVALECVDARGPFRLRVGLGMTGSLLWRPGPALAPLPHLRARLRLAGGTVAFTDPRRFGRLRLEDGPSARCSGLDPLTPRFTPRALAALLAAARGPLKPWLLRQDRLVGIGNIYASEILFHARLHPARSGRTLDPAEVRRLHRSVRRILLRAVRACGTTFSDFRDPFGERGAYQQRLAVYGRHGHPCPRCRTPVARSVQSGRSTFHCPACQPSPGPG